MQLIFNESAKIEDFEIASAAIIDQIESSQISSIKDNASEPMEKKTSVEERQLMPTFAATPKITSEPAAISETNSDPTFVPKASNPIRRGRRPIPPVPEDAIAMSIRFRKQAYAAALKKVIDFSPYYSAFAVGLIRLDFESKIYLHWDSLSIESKHGHQMLKHRFAKEFQLAASQEIGELEKRNTYQIIKKKNQDQAKISLIGVFKYKFDTDDYLIKFKTRLCVREDLQTIYEKTYAAILAARTFRAVMTIAAAFDMEIHQFDAVNAFINSRLNEKIFCECSKGFRQPDKCWKLFHVLYRLKQAPMLGHKELTTALKDLRLMPVFEINCFYANDWLIFFFYVDDIMMLSTKSNADKLQEFEKKLLMKFQIKALKELNGFLNIRIIRNRDDRKIGLCQNFYISKMIAKFNLKEEKNFNTPLADVPHATEKKALDQMIYEYQQRIESINFAAVIIRLDIAGATSRLFQFLQNPSKKNIRSTDCVISYLSRTKNFAIEYSGKLNSNIFNCASDAAFEDDEMTRKSSDGYFFQLYRGAVDWRAAKQTTVITSSTEAELLAISRTEKEAIWWRRFFESIKFDTEEKLMIKCDNR